MKNCVALSCCCASCASGKQGVFVTIKMPHRVFKTPAERSFFSATKTICFLIGDPCPAPSLFRKRFLLPVMSYQDQFGFVVGGSSALRIRLSRVAASVRGSVDGVGRGLIWGGPGHRHLLLLRLTDGAQRQPWKCLYGGASLEGGAAHEGQETPVELHTHTRRT